MSTVQYAIRDAHGAIDIYPGETAELTDDDVIGVAKEMHAILKMFGIKEPGTQTLMRADSPEAEWVDLYEFD